MKAGRRSLGNLVVVVALTLAIGIGVTSALLGTIEAFLLSQKSR